VHLALKLPGAVEGALADNVREAVGLRILPAFRPAAVLAGQVDELVLEARSALFGEFARRRAGAPLRVHDVRVRVTGLLFHPRRLAETGKLELLDVKALAVERLVITQSDLSEFLRGQRGLAGGRVALEDGRARVTLPLPGPDLAARIRVLPGADGSPFALQADDVRYGALRLPRWLVDSIVRNFDPTPRLRRLPVAVTLAPVRITAGRIEVGGAAGEPTRPTEKR
jgi:hypothetical protein